MSKSVISKTGFLLNRTFPLPFFLIAVMTIAEQFRIPNLTISEIHLPICRNQYYRFLNSVTYRVISERFTHRTTVTTTTGHINFQSFDYLTNNCQSSRLPCFRLQSFQKPYSIEIIIFEHSWFLYFLITKHSVLPFLWYLYQGRFGIFD